METGSGQDKQFDQTVPDTENLTAGRQHSFTRRNRGQRTQIVDEEAKKVDDAFWDNNPLFAKPSNSKGAAEESDSDEENDQENNEGQIQEEYDDDDDEDDDEDYEEEMESSDDDQEGPSDEEESQSNAGKAQNEVAADPEPTVEEEKEAEGLKFYVKNHERHFFFRPVFLQLDIEATEKQDWSYIKLPPHMTLQDGRGENDIARQCINKRYIGVPPKAAEDERRPLHMPTNYSYEIFKCEDERYFIDLNIKKYKAIIKYLEDIASTADEGLKREKLKDIIKSNRMVRQKYELDETPDENQRLQNVLGDINHDLENLYKKRARSDILTKKKKEILYPLIVRDQEIRAASEEKQGLTNGRILNEITRYYATVLPKELTAPLSQKLLDYNQFYKKYRNIFFSSELHQALFKNSPDFQDAFNKNIHSLFVSYRASPYSILPANLFYISDKTIFSHAIQLALFYINSTLLIGKELSVMRFRAILQDYFGLEIEGEPLTVNPDSQEFKDLLEDLVKYERFPAEEFSAENICKKNQSHTKPQKSPAHELFVDKDMNPPLQKDFKLFLPATHVENERVPEKASYGTHFYYFVIRYIYTIYLKLLLASNLSAEEKPHQGLALPAFDIYLQLTACHALDKVETMKYDLAVLNLFGSKGKHLLNLKFLLYQTLKAVQSLNDDKLSNEFFDKALGKINENEPEQELFTFTCDFINSADEEIKNTENFVYRFHLNPSRGWFSTSVFDIKGVFMRTLKTQEKIPLASTQPSNISPKTITVKRNTPPPQTGTTEVITQVSTVTEAILEASGSGELLGKRTERIETQEVVTEGGEPTVGKKLHSE